jgi:S1-C subfamily serine protease
MFLLVLTIIFGRSTGETSNIVHDQDSNENIEEATKLIVMVEGKLASTPTFGAGIIFGWENNALYIATADHVVRRGEEEANDLTVKLKSQPNKSFKAVLLGHFNRDLDLAVLRIESLQEQGINVSSLDMRVLSQPGSSDRGDAVFPVGNPNGVPWGIPVIPDRIAQIVGDGIVFQSVFISNGHSGGGLVDDGGVLTGMIIQDSPPFGFATNIGAIHEQLREWGYPVEWKLAAGYAVEGKWKVDDHPLFHLLTLKVNGNKVSGSGDMLNTNAGAPGITIKPLTDELAEKSGVSKDGGVFVEGVQDGRPAFKAGIRRGDIITSFNGEGINSVEDLFLKIISLPHSHNFEIKAIRNGKSHNFQGKLGKSEGTDIFIYNESATRVTVKLEQPAVFNGDIRGNHLTINGKGVWLELQRKTGGFTQAFSSQAKFSVALQGRVTGEAIHFQYKFEYPDLGNHSTGKFTAIRIED